ncbi:cation:dicarboxylate symporter family transporter [Arthrobacter wenxiniae]|jgi:aerobic C4-dicarboxylate transport protein|uniref:Cation:dicarboxylase symporter family transporter n=1 Tax=Arthrobacter wenxiniae TaxID=2713570 RepID=A0A7Y7IDY1_9MICC|nr:cation:dicarboxylase symporter family transporter [Arthrobacter wenxiniae]NVM93719.1 cation:dicarboxylase symporter family transporter [Arthrobacter wenxiniae]
MKTLQQLSSAPSASAARKKWYRGLGAQVMIAMAVGIVFGFALPGIASQFKIVGDLFLSLIKAGVAPLVFLTVVLGIGAAGDLKKASRIGFFALVYFEVLSTVALLLGLVAGNLFGVGKGAHALQSSAGAAPAGAAEPGFTAFLKGIFPDNFIGAFSSGQLLQVLILAIIFGAGLLTLKPHMRAKVTGGLETISEAMFGFINVIMKLAPIGAFGAIAYAVGTNGSAMLLALAELVLQYWAVIAFFVFGVLGLVSLLSGFNIFRVLRYVRIEMSLVLGTASSESALPGLLRKLPMMGVSKQAVGLVVPTGYAFNLDGTSIYMALSTLFLANVYGIHMGIPEQIGLLVIMLLTSKGAATVSGGTYVVFAATIAATGYLPIEGVAILFGVYRFMSIATAFCNTFGNVVATLVVAKWTKELHMPTVREALADPTGFWLKADREEYDADASLGGPPAGAPSDAAVARADQAGPAGEPENQDELTAVVRSH